jgi:hypothetical protein
MSRTIYFNQSIKPVFLPLLLTKSVVDQPLFFRNCNKKNGAVNMEFSHLKKNHVPLQNLNQIFTTFSSSPFSFIPVFHS